MSTIKVKLRNKNGGETAIHRIAVDDSYEQWWARYGSPDLRAVYENFGMEVFRRSSCLDGFAAFLKANGFTGRRCIEIGTCNGLTAIVLARLFDEVVSIDTVPRPVKHEVVKFCGLENVRFIDVANNTEKAEAVDGLAFDAAYSDGDHAHDAQTDLDLVKHCGLVLFHEYWPLCPQVWGQVNALRAEGEVVSSGTYAIWRARRG